MHNGNRSALLNSGMELMDDKKSRLIEIIKNVIIELVHYPEELPKTNFSVYLSEKPITTIPTLANLFSEVESTTIRYFMITHKIERVKELLVYNKLNLTEIAYKLHYSSVAHLPNKFKKITGLTPSDFKKVRHKRRIMLENV